MKKNLIIVLVSIATLGGYMFWRTQINDVPTTQTSDSSNSGVDDDSPGAESGVGKINPDGTIVGGTKEGDAENQGDVDENSNGSEQTKNVVVTLSRVTVGDDLVTVTGYAESPKAGSCTLLLTQPGQNKLSYTNPAELEVSNYSCNPFRIDISDFPVGGKWWAVISFSAPGITGSSNTWEFEL